MSEEFGFETILDVAISNAALEGIAEENCVDCYDCDYNCEECDTDH